MADAFPDVDAPAVMATPGPPPGLAPINLPAVSRGAVVGPAQESLAHNRIKTDHVNKKDGYGLADARQEAWSARRERVRRGEKGGDDRPAAAADSRISDSWAAAAAEGARACFPFTVYIAFPCFAVCL